MIGILKTDIDTECAYERADKIKRSSYEERVSFILDKQLLFYEEEKTFRRLGLMRYDFYVPEYNLLIEVQGEQHERPSFGMDEEQFAQYQANDQIKKDYAIENGFNFLEIWYHEIDKAEDMLKPYLT